MNPRTRSLVLVGLVLAVGVGAYGVRLWREWSHGADVRRQLFADLDRVLAQHDRNAPELSRLVAQLHQQDPESRDVAVALARVELLRGRYEGAARYLEPLLLTGGDPEDDSLAADVWLGWSQTGGHDRNERQSLLRQALRHAEAAYSAGGHPEDLLIAWIACQRLGDHDARQQLGETMRTRHAGTREANAVAFLERAGDLSQPVEPVEQLLADWADPPVELRLLAAVLLLQHGSVERGVQLIDELLLVAPNMFDVRQAAAAAHHMAGLAMAAGSERERQLDLRDEQIRWLDANADPAEPLRPTWLQMRQQR